MTWTCNRSVKYMKVLKAVPPHRLLGRMHHHEDQEELSSTLSVSPAAMSDKKDSLRTTAVTQIVAHISFFDDIIKIKR